MAKNSKYDDAQIAQWVQDNPIRVREDGGILTCPVRLAFPHLGKPQTQNNDDGTTRDTYNVALLFPAAAGSHLTGGQVFDVLYTAWWNDCNSAFPDKNVNNGFPGLHMPFHDQAEKSATYDGYEPGSVYLNVSSDFKPQIVDMAGNAILDGPAFDSRVYPGVWAIVSMTHYAFGTKPKSKKKGASFGLSSIMIIADDNSLGGGAEDTKKAFAGVKMDRKFDPASAFAAGPPAAPNAPLPLVQSNGPVSPAPMAAAPPPPAAPKVWPAAGGGCDPSVLAGAGWTADQMLAAGYAVPDLIAFGVL